jgi:hypothetical protein
MRSTRAALSGSVLLAAWLLLGSSAHAHRGSHEYDDADRPHSKLMLALDLDYASVLSPDILQEGGGGAVRIGTEHDLFLVSLIPELTLDYHSFGTDTRDSAKIFTGKLGGRIRFLKIVEPGIFAHVGVGNIGGYNTVSHTGVALDMGATLDLTILPLIDLGLHVAWNRIFGGYDEGTSYYTSGAHVALVF